MKINSLCLMTILFLFLKSSSCLKASTNIDISHKGLRTDRENKRHNVKTNETIIYIKSTRQNLKNYSDTIQKTKNITLEPNPDIILLQTKTNPHTPEQKLANPQYNFTIVSSNDSLFNVLHHKTNQTVVFNTELPFDEYQYAFKISNGCNIDNCRYPNVCLNKDTCACDNFFANFFLDGNDKVNNNPDKNTQFCSYHRKDQLTLSLFELFLPGIGFIYNGFYLYGGIKSFISLVLITIIILKLGRFLEKDSLPIDDENFVFIEYKRDFHFYLTIVSYTILVIWTFVDLITVSYRFRTDPNGVNFRLGYLIDDIIKH